jgi:hypothetical protein
MTISTDERNDIMKALALSIAVLALVTTSASAQQLRPWRPPSHNLLPQQQWDLWSQPTWQEEEALRQERQMQERRHQEMLDALRPHRQRRLFPCDACINSDDED